MSCTRVHDRRELFYGHLNICVLPSHHPMLPDPTNAEAIDTNPDLQNTELASLRQALQHLQQENQDLKIALSTIAEHGDLVEAELCKTNTKLESEVIERNRAEITLQSLVKLITQQKDDLEIILDTLIVHGDVLDAQWQQKISQAQLLAISDGLTKIANRRRFDEYLAEQWQRTARAQTPLSILLCDIDYFKQYNDIYGHIAGDACLKQVVKALDSAIFRSADLLARYGGEEFAVVLPQTDSEQALKVAQRMQIALSQCQIVHTGSQIGACLTVSIGIVSLIPLEEQSVSLALQEADRQLYRAKRAGRNRISANYLNLSEIPPSL
jgi:diguanylate cyclase (GGDEF)-like protein